MLKIRTLSGAIFTIIYVTEDDVIYRDILKYIDIPYDKRFKILDRKMIKSFFKYDIHVEHTIKLLFNGENINLDDMIDFSNDLTLVYTSQYFYCRPYCNPYYDEGCTLEPILSVETINDINDADVLANIIEECPFAIAFIKEPSDELYKIALNKTVRSIKYIDKKYQTHALQFVDEEYKKIALHLINS